MGLQIEDIAAIFHKNNPVILQAHGAIHFTAFPQTGDNTAILSFSLQRNLSCSRKEKNIFTQRHHLRSIMVFHYRHRLVPYYLGYTVMTTNPYSTLFILGYIGNVIRREIMVLFSENHRYKFTIRISHLTTSVSILP